jgi:hypothetical protein
MSRTYHHYKNRDIRVRGIRRPTDLPRLAQTLIDLQQAKDEAEAEAEHKQEDQSKAKKDGPGKGRTTSRKNNKENT